MQRASVFYVPKTVYDYPEDQLGNEDKMIDDINQSLCKYLEDNQVKRGDIVVLQEEDGYRNDYRFIYNGEEICCLDYDPPCGYDYGIVPSNFLCITEFPMGYWDDALKGWNLCYILFNDSMKREIIENAVLVEDDLYKSEFSLAGLPVIVYIATVNDTVEECVNSWVAKHGFENKLCVTGDMEDIAETGPNIIHILSPNY